MQRACRIVAACLSALTVAAALGLWWLRAASLSPRARCGCSVVVGSYRRVFVTGPRTWVFDAWMLGRPACVYFWGLGGPGGILPEVGGRSPSPSGMVLGPPGPPRPGKLTTSGLPKNHKYRLRTGFSVGRRGLCLSCGRIFASTRPLYVRNPGGRAGRGGERARKGPGRGLLRSCIRSGTEWARVGPWGVALCQLAVSAPGTLRFVGAPGP